MLSAKQLAPILDNLTTGILVLDLSKEVKYSNAAAQMILEVSGQRNNGAGISELLNKQAGQLTGLDECIRHGHSYTQREVEILLPSGNRAFIDYTAAPFTAVNPDWILMEISTRERLQRISREEELLANQATSRMLIRGLAHEIKNPLGGIRGAAQLLSRALKDEDQKDYTEIIIAESDRLRNLVDRMLGPHQALQMDSVNIHEVLERILSLIEVENDHPIRLVRDYDPSLPEFPGDKEQLIQAFLNICRNAMQALQSMPDHPTPTLTIRTRPLRQFTIGSSRYRLVLRVDIIDNGPGIPENLRKNIFYPMVSGRAEGTGLGLSITQSIISQHAGLVECESEPGLTNFIVFIPLETSE